MWKKGILTFICIMVLIIKFPTPAVYAENIVVKQYLGEWQSVSPNTYYFVTIKQDTSGNYTIFAGFQAPDQGDELFNSVLDIESKSKATFKYAFPEENPAKKQGTLSFLKDKLEMVYMNGSEKRIVILERKTERIKVFIDNEEIHLDPAPKFRNGSVIIPMRPIFEYFGAELLWDKEKQTIKVDANTNSFTLKIGSLQATLNGKTIQLNESPKIINNITFVPLRFVSESFGATVQWNAIQHSVHIRSND
ncbi:stalk domain-containing protein [Paenibacillus sp. RS8]|uniref:Copper amine oxidase-like N-terminal domain-containing protein n=1 Tax=Paenibacillus odorifer TaxID=189426 RepID=A0A1R0Y9J2_9BACL|nr:stalk domain-containing protein [Paenibacillus odorifer]OMD44027.1 hypothetical protein BSK52_00305 [Paenibacillus odorifer]